MESLKGMFKGMGQVTNKEREMFEAAEGLRGRSGSGSGAITNKERDIVEKAAPGSVTKTRESVTVAPAKKHGGRVKKC